MEKVGSRGVESVTPSVGEKAVFAKYSLSGGYDTESLGKTYGDVTSLMKDVAVNERQTQTVANQDVSTTKIASKEKIEKQIGIINVNSKRIGDAMSDALHSPDSANLGIIGSNGILYSKELDQKPGYDQLLTTFKEFVNQVDICLQENPKLTLGLQGALESFKFFYARSSVGAFNFNGFDPQTTIREIFNNLKTLLEEGNVFDGKDPLIQEFMAVQMLCRMNDVVQNLPRKGDAAYQNIANFVDQLECIQNLGVGKQQNAVDKIRQHEMFYEIPLAELDDAIVDAMMRVINDNDIQSQTDANTIINNEQLKKLASNFLKKSREIDGNGQICGMRGRMRAANLSKDIANRSKGPYNDYYALIGDKHDGICKKGQELCQVLKTQQAFPNDTVARPGQFAVEGMLLPSRVAIINDPIAFLNDCLSEDSINAYNKDHHEDQIDAGSFSFKIDNELSKNISQAICDCELSKKTDQFTRVSDLLVHDKQDHVKMPYESKPNIASAMKKAGLRTICSVSGTTTDIVAALWAMNQKDTEKALQSLNDFVESLPQDGSDIGSSYAKLNDNFKRLFLSIAVYMQSGEYHSAAEVLGGLYSAAQVLCKETTTVDVKKYEQLFIAFAEHPSDFFPKGNAE